MIVQNTCQRVAAMKKGENKRQWIAICYDEVARKAWSERAYENDTSLDLDKVADNICPNLVQKAVTKYDAIEQATCFSCAMCFC